MNREFEQSSLQQARGELLTLISQRANQLVEVQPKIVLTSLADYLKYLENGWQTEVNVLTTLVGKVIGLGYRWQYEKYYGEYSERNIKLSPEKFRQLATAFALTAELSTRDQYLLGVDSPSRGVQKTSKLVLANTNLRNQEIPEQVDQVKQLASEVSLLPGTLEGTALDIVQDNQQLRMDLVQLTRFSYGNLNLKERQGIVDEAVIRKIKRMKTNVVEVREERGTKKEFDEYSLEVQKQIGVLLDQEEQPKDIKAIARAKARESIAQSIPEEEVLAALYEEVTRSIVQASSLEAIRLAVAERAPSILPWFPDPDITDWSSDQIKQIAETKVQQILQEQVQIRLRRYQEDAEVVKQGVSNEYSKRNIERVINDFLAREGQGLVVGSTLPPVLKVREYLEVLQKVKPEYFVEVQALADQFPEMDPQTKYVVAIPVVGFGGQSRATILRTLQAFSDQKELGGYAEINCFVNKPPEVDFDETMDLIDGFDPMNPDIKIAAGSLEVARNQKARPLMGKIRALQIDAILLRASQTFRDCTDQPPIIVMGDDDTEEITPNALRNYRERFQQVPNLDLIIGELRFDSKQYPSVLFPPFYVADELMYLLPQLNKSFVNGLSEKREPLTDTEKTALMTCLFSSTFTKGLQINYAFRAEAYAEVGGAFNPEQDVNELDYMVRSIALPAWRAGRCNIGALGEEVKVLSSSRRALLEYLEGEGRAPIEQWRGKWEIRVNDPARIKQPDDLVGVIPISELEDKDIEALVPELEVQINRTLDEYKPPIEVKGWYISSIDNYLDALKAIGLAIDDYDMEIAKENGSWRVQIRLKKTPQDLLDRLGVYQTQSLQQRQIQMEEVSLATDQIVRGNVVRNNLDLKAEDIRRRMVKLPLS